uniref:Uncharacterized protein n=1 Tax=Arion vulgaris TaxID=1028688 RepID=A0A0B6Z0A4_9EUPU
MMMVIMMRVKVMMMVIMMVIMVNYEDSEYFVGDGDSGIDDIGEACEVDGDKDDYGDDIYYDNDCGDCCCEHLVN